MTSLLREETPVPMPEAASATTTSCPAMAAARATASPTTPAPTTSTCIRPARSHLDRQPGVMLGERAQGGCGARHVGELGAGVFATEGVVAGIEINQLRHPPEKALPLPPPPQTGRRITLQQVAAAALIE